MQKNEQIERKSQELAFALIRVAAYIRKIELKSRIEALSFKLAQLVGEERFGEALPVLNGLKNLLELGKHLLVIEPVNVKILLQEIEYLRNLIRQSAAVEPLPDLNAIFSKNEANEITTVKINVEKSQNTAKTVNTAKSEKAATISKIDSDVSAIRQEKLIEKIRQSPNARLKDLLAEFPGISERTIRYDLKKLTDDGKIERQGTGGPSNFYVLKQQSYPQV